MENYDVVSVAGEGSYGIVMKCRNKITKKVVAIKKLIDIEGDRYAKKMAFREIRILRKLQHENLVKLLEVFRKKKRFYLVFEYLDRTVLDDIEDNPQGLGEKRTKEYMFQLLRGIEYCHSKNVIHRDIKPENLLVSKCGILKLCDFGFARVLNTSNAVYTEYIATRWYRAPELLVRDRNYGRSVDIWAIGCVFAELLNGEPLFPGDSDVDQLFQITKRFGKLCARHQLLLSTFQKSNEFGKAELKTNESQAMNNLHALHISFPTWSTLCLNIIAMCLELDPDKRPSAVELLGHEYFDENNFRENFHLSVPQSRRKKTPRKSSITIEFDSEHCNSSLSTPRILNNLRKTPSPFSNFRYTATDFKSPSLLKYNTFGKHLRTNVDVNNSNSTLNIQKIIPFNVDQIYSNKKNVDHPKSPPFSLRWPECIPHVKYENVGQEPPVWKDDQREEIRELPKPQVIQLKKIPNFNQRHTDAELNLPYIHSTGGTPKTKPKTIPFLIEAVDNT